MYAHELFEQNKPRVVVTYPGRFQPFHQGHAGVFSQLQKKFGAENVFIATSNDQSSAKSPFNFSDKYQLMTAAGVPADKIIQTNAMYALPEGIDPLNTIFITAVGAPDADRLNPDSVLKRDKKDKSGNTIKAAGNPGYYKKWDPSRDPVSADQHGYVIVIPEIKKSIKIGSQTYDVSHGTETRNLWNAVRDDEKSRLEFLSQLYGRPSSELANIFDKIPQTAKEDIAPGSSDSTSPIHGGQIYEQVVAEGWSQKYKRSINCSHPRGFSQKAHCAGKRKHNESIETEMVCEDCGMCETHGDHSQDNLAEACWKGYHKEGMKTMFGKRYPNCVKNKNESLETYIRKGECPGCGERMIAESQLNEKQDACYHKVKSRYKVWPSAYASGALVQCRKKGAANWGNKSESITQEEYDQLDENLKKWFSDKWVRFGPDGKIRGDCARGDSSEGKPKCLPQSKAHSLGKKGRASAAAKKRREDPNPERRGSAINVATKTKSNEDASGVIATKKQARDPRYSMSLTKDVRPGQIEKNLRAFKLAEQANNNNLMFELFAKFLPLAMRDLGLTMLPKIVPELRIESTDGQASFGRFVDGEMIIQLAMANRHPVDILRTLAHELVHYKQKTLGKIKHDSGETGSPEENQANTIAGIIMRHFNKEYPDAVNMQPIDLNESQVTVNYGIGKNPGRLVKVGADGRVPHAKLHVNVNKKTAKKLGIPHFNEGVADVAKAAAYFIPGVGPAMAAYDVYNAAKTGSAKDVASSLVGFIPGAKGLAAARAINVGKAAYDYQQATADINKPKNTATALAPIQPKDNEFEPIDSTPKNTTAPLAPIQPKDNEIGTVDENFADGRNPGDKGSLKAKVKGKVTMAKARAILNNKNSTPRAKQLAHWFINMNKGRNK